MTEIFSLAGKKIWVAGHRGMAGSAIMRRLATENCEIVTVERGRLDLGDRKAVETWLAQNRPDAIFLAAAKVGGIAANMARPAEFLYDNLVIAANVIHGAWKAQVAKLLFLGSSCVYPRMAPQPMREEALLTGPFEPTNEAYAIAKVAGIEMCRAYRRQYDCDFITAVPANLLGPGDRFDLENGHVVAALIMKIAAAKREGQDSVTLWGTGTARREFLSVDDMADGAAFLMQHYSGESPVNLGTGQDMTILELAEHIAAVAGWRGRFVCDPSKPDGMPRKVMDVSRLAAMGWKAATPLDIALKQAFAWYEQTKGH